MSLFFSFICFSSIFQFIRWNFLFIHQFQQCLTKHPWRPVRYFSYYKSFSGEFSLLSSNNFALKLEIKNTIMLQDVISSQDQISIVILFSSTTLFNLYYHWFIVVSKNWNEHFIFSILLKYTMHRSYKFKFDLINWLVCFLLWGNPRISIN